MSRPPRRRRICGRPQVDAFCPKGRCGAAPILLTLDEYEVIRLVDLEQQTHAQCAAQMDVSRSTVQAIYESARRKIAACLVHGKPLHITGGVNGAGIGAGCYGYSGKAIHGGAGERLYFYSGTVNASGGRLAAGIGGGQYVPARDITITDATLNLSSLYHFTNSSTSAIGFGDLVYNTEELVTDPSIATNDQIRIGSYKGKLVKLKLEARALSRDDEYSYFWNLYETLIPDENGLIDMQLLTLPYVQNYGWAINVLEMTVIDDPCNGKHDFGWVTRQSCHIWACMKCQARDPAAEMSKRNGKNIPDDWGIQEKRCTVCDHLLEKDTAAPVMEVLNDGESYTVEDVIVGRPGAYTFTVSDPAKIGEASSGVKSVTINGVEQAVSSFYSLPAPDGGNNDAGAEYTVVATDNAGNASAATVKIYRRHRVRVVSIASTAKSKTFSATRRQRKSWRNIFRAARPILR